MKPDTAAEGEAQGEESTAATNTIEGGAGNDTITHEEAEEHAADQGEHEHEGLADHPDDVREGPTEEQLQEIGRTVRLADEALERAEGPKHGTHNAAMAGLQTDASGSTPPKFPRGDGYE